MSKAESDTWNTFYFLWSGPLLKGRHVDLLIVGSFSMRVLPLLVYQGLACLLILTGHVCGQGKETWTPWTFVSIKFDRVSISSRNGERKEIIRLDCLSCTDSPQKHSVCVNLNSLSIESCNYFQKLHFKLAQKDLSESLNAHVFSWCIFNVLKKCHFV